MSHISRGTDMDTGGIRKMGGMPSFSGFVCSSRKSSCRQAVMQEKIRETEE